MFADFSLKTLPFITPTTFYLKDKKKKENNNYKDIDLYLQLNRIVLAQPRKKQKSPTKILLLWQVKLENAFNLLLSKQIFSRTLTICLEKPEILLLSQMLHFIPEKYGGFFLLFNTR